MRKFCMLFTLLLFVDIATAQIPGILWEKKYGGSGPDQLFDVLIHDDGTFIVVGSSKSNDRDITGHHGSTDSTDAWIARLDADGNIMWQRSVGGANNDVFTTVIKGVDQSFICIGSTSSNDGDVSNAHGGRDVWVVKMNYDGTIAWSKTYGGSRNDEGIDAVITQDQHYAIIGNITSRDGDIASPATDTSAWVIKISSSGTLLWEKSVAGTGAASRAHGIEAGENNDLMISISTRTQTLEGYFYQHWVNHWPARLYSVDNTNGNYQIASDGGGEYDVSFVKGSDGYYIAGSHHVYEYTEFCFRRYDYVWKKNFNTPNTVRQGNAENGNYDCPGGVNFHRYGPYHGVVENEGSFVVAGLRHDNITGTFGLLKYGSREYLTYPDEGGFNSIKSFPAGNDFIMVGFTGQLDYANLPVPVDTWIIRVKGHNRITGNVFLDENNNGVKDNGEPPFNHGRVKTTKSSFRLESFPIDGTYSNFVDTGIFVTQLIPESPYYTVLPATESSVFTQFNQRDTIHFAVRASANIVDKNISLLPLTATRAGFEAGYKIVFANKGTVSNTTDTIRLELDPRTSLVNAAPQPTSNSGGIVTWHLTGIQPFGSGEINITLQLEPPPVLNNMDVIFFSAQYVAAGDVDSLDNVSLLQQEVTGSFDPNDKNENYNGEMPVTDLNGGKWLNYVIRFQNTGNDTAFNIIIRDTLTDRLNTDSIAFSGSSHHCTMSLKDGKFLTFTFPNILLVDSLRNEALSHGFVSFRIRPNATTLNIGDTVLNKASIYFDYNLPIVTNEHQTKIVDQPVQQEPIVIFDLTGESMNGMVDLNWKTDNEFLITEFDIEHSTNRTGFTAIGNVPSLGNSPDPQQYSFTHLNPSIGDNFYRVRAKRANGWNLLSAEIRVQITAAPVIDNSIIVSPNPVNGTLTISIASEAEAAGSVRIVDMGGKTVFKNRINLAVGDNRQQVDCAKFPAGIYQVIVNRNGRDEVIRFVKK